MKFFAVIIVLVLAFFILDPLSDSYTKLLDDRISWMDDLTEVVDGVASGWIPVSQGVRDLQKLREKNDKLMARYADLVVEKPDDNPAEAYTKHKEEIQKVNTKLTDASTRLRRSGHITPEFAQALSRVSTPMSSGSASGGEMFAGYFVSP